MAFFIEHPINHSTLTDLGVDDQRARSLLIEHFNSLLGYSGCEFGHALVKFLETTAALARRAAASDTALAPMRLENENLRAKLSTMEDEARSLRSGADLARAQNADLNVVIDRQREGLSAYKEKLGRYVGENKEMRRASDRLVRRVAELEVLCASLSADKASLEHKLAAALKSAVADREVRLKAKRARKDRMAQMNATLPHRLPKMFRVSAGVGRRGLPKGALGGGAVLRRRRAAIAKLLSITAAARDGGAQTAKEAALEQELEKVREQLAQARQGFATTSNQIFSARAELLRRSEVERAIREQHFYDSFGVQIVCPVPTMDGVLVPLADVYREWRSAAAARAMVSAGMCSEFDCPRSGHRTSLAPIGVINLVRGVAGIIGADLSLPFTVQFHTGDGATWADFPLIDQLDIVARLCAAVQGHHQPGTAAAEGGSRFRVLGAAEFEIFFAPDSGDAAQAHGQQGGRRVSIACGIGSTAYGVRIVGAVGDFFVGERAALSA